MLCQHIRYNCQYLNNQHQLKDTRCTSTVSIFSNNVIQAIMYNRQNAYYTVINHRTLFQSLAPTTSSRDPRPATRTCYTTFKTLQYLGIASLKQSKIVYNVEDDATPNAAVELLASTSWGARRYHFTGQHGPALQ
jgi:hypothetical protein